MGLKTKNGTFFRNKIDLPKLKVKKNAFTKSSDKDRIFILKI